MEKYKRYSKELPTTGEDIQEFLNQMTADGWEIIYYNEREYGGMGMVKVTVIAKITSEVL